VATDADVAESALIAERLQAHDLLEDDHQQAIKAQDTLQKIHTTSAL